MGKQVFRLNGSKNSRNWCNLNVFLKHWISENSFWKSSFFYVHLRSLRFLRNSNLYLITRAKCIIWRKLMPMDTVYKYTLWQQFANRHQSRHPVTYCILTVSPKGYVPEGHILITRWCFLPNRDHLYRPWHVRQPCVQTNVRPVSSADPVAQRVLMLTSVPELPVSNMGREIE